MWYVILYVVIAAFVVAILKVAFDLDPSRDEDELCILAFGGIFWPLTIAVGSFYLLVKLFIIIVKLIEKGLRYLISKINIQNVKLL